MYGNYFGYQPQGQLEQYKQPYQYHQQVQTDERIWVNGEGQARDYLIAPNGFVRLWDSSSNVFYEKRADASGRPFMEAYEYTRRIDSKPPIRADEPIDYTSKLKALEERIQALEEGVRHEQSNTDD